MEKQTSMNNRHHRIKLEEIKVYKSSIQKSKHKDDKVSTKVLDLKSKRFKELGIKFHIQKGKKKLQEKMPCYLIN